MAVIQAYIDDSGNSDGNDNPVFVLAGYVSSADRWAEFSREWEIECSQPPALLNFKMAHANGFRGDFHGWSRADRDARLSKLAAIIQRHTCLRVQTSIAWEDYNSVMRGKMPGLLDSPYIWLLWKLIVAMSHWQQANGLASKVDFIFDDQGPHGVEAATWYESLRGVVPPAEAALMGSVLHRHDADVLPLKAADMWAWHVRRYLAAGVTNIRGGGPAPKHTDLMKELMHCPAVGDFLDRIDVENVLAAYQKGVDDARAGVRPFWEQGD